MSRAMTDAGSDLLRANRRVTTVLIADLVGSSSLAEEIDPEDLDHILKRLIEGERRIVTERYGGTIFGSDGDDIKALFGDPVAHEDDPCRAVRCAIELQEFARKIAKEFPELDGRSLLLHTGIATGLVITKSGNSTAHGPTGDAINTAARLVHVADPGEIVVEAATERDIAAAFETEPLGLIPLKGKREPVEVFRVLRPIPHAWFEVTCARGLSPFVGRDSALAVLEDALQSARGGRGRFVTVGGEPGVGKSRLLYELRQRTGDAIRVTLAECDAGPTVAPFHPFLAVLRELFGVSQSDPPAMQRERVAAVASHLDAALEEYVPLYYQLLSIRTEETPIPSHLRDERLARALREAIAQLVAAAASSTPLALLLEDWHLADDASRTTLSRLVEGIASHSMVVVATYRSEWPPQWAGCTPLEIRLPPLGVDDARIVIVSRLGEDVASKALVEHLHQRTGGNPLFLDEICRSLREIGYRPSAGRPADDIVVPTTVQAVIRARIDRLDPRLRRLLHLASVLGLSFSRDLLALFADQGENAIGAMLEELRELDLIIEERTPDRAATRHRFKHAITRDVAYKMLLLEDRRQLHRHAGAAIEALFPVNRVTEYDEVLADHYEIGGDFPRAALFARRAGDKAAATFSLGAARTWYRRAIELLDTLGDGADTVRERLDVSGRWAEVCVYDPASADNAVLQRSHDLSEAIGDRRRAARAVYWMGWFEHARGDHHAATRHFERAFELVEETKDGRIVPQLQTNLGQSAYHRGELRLASNRLERVLAEGDRSIVTANALGYLALIDAERGRFATANARWQTALEIVRELEQRQLEGSILTIAAYVALFQGKWEACLAHAAEMRAIAAVIDAPYILAMSKTADGYARWFLSQDATAFAPMRQAIGELEASGSRLSMSVNYACLAEVMALTGEREEARRLAEKARDRAVSGDRVGEVQACRALGIAEAGAVPPRIEPARMHVEHGMELAVARGSRREAAVTRWRLAEALAKSDHRAEALGLANDVAAAFEDCEMEWHAAQARALARQLTTDE